ncbi:hypothetical protein VIN01S_10730 [Vibrio inusitatus NBRC 102082]|uniref:Uncharacterized protein n=1 Tax=Vibrio inusitatus NBRC 102082 TaxID=1219070 RepID=A0A4Y3HSZ6_9VIBR|nr:hypothetical protein [Vibrio inusitatus]GEA50269.1 hypothetical protein VIN01S_10730 [Vibrio inusitatus NBRC 102082]
MKCYIYLSCVLFSSVVSADTISIINKSESLIYGAFQSKIMTGVAADSVNGYIKDGKDHVYFESDGFFSHDSIDIKVGDVIPKVSIFNQTLNRYEICAENLVFEGALTFSYDGEECQRVHNQFAHSTSAPFDITTYGGSRGGASLRERIILPTVAEYKGIRTMYNLTQEHSGYGGEYARYTGTFLFRSPWETETLQHRGYIKQGEVNKVDWYAPLGATKYFFYDNESFDLKGIPGGDEITIQHFNKNGNYMAYHPETGELNYNTLTYSDLRIELFEPKVTLIEGVIGTTGEWKRPDFDYFTNEDNGRIKENIPYTSIPFTVDENGYYGFKVINRGPLGDWKIAQSVLYIFDGVPKENGHYKNMLAENSLGHIPGVFLEKGKEYYIVNSDAYEATSDSFYIHVGGPQLINH